MTPDSLLSHSLLSHSLLGHVDFLRRLAKALVGESEADDVVQETLSTALARPPARRDNVRGWLGTVARNFALKRIRARNRRRKHERAAATPEGTVGAAGDTAARIETERAVVEAVAGLAEPFRTTILRRYYDGLKPRQIARADGVPVATVKSRLRRGLRELRGQLDESHGSRAAWLAVLAPLARRATAWVASGALAAVALVVAVAGVAGIWAVQRAKSDETPTRSAYARAAGSPDGEQREATESVVGTDGDASFARARLRVVGPHGPVAGATVRISGPAFGNVVSGSTTGADGSTTATVDPPGMYLVDVDAPGFAPMQRSLQLPADHEIAIGGGARLILTPQDYPGPEWKGAYAEVAWRGTSRRVRLRRRTDAGSWPAGVVTVRVKARVPGGMWPRPLKVAMPAEGEVVFPLANPPWHRVVFDVPTEARVRGAPVDRAPQQWRDIRTQPTDDGLAAFVPERPYVLRLDAPGFAPAFAMVPAGGLIPNPLPIDLGLLRPASLAIRLPAGHSVRTVRVHYGGFAPGGRAGQRNMPYLFQRVLSGETKAGRLDLDRHKVLQPLGILAEQAVNGREEVVFRGLRSVERVTVVGIDEHGYTTEAKAIVGAPGTTAGVALEPARKVARTLVVVDQDKKPVPGAHVLVVRTGAAHTDESGRLRLLGVRANEPLRLFVRFGFKNSQLAVPAPGAKVDGVLWARVERPPSRTVNIAVRTFDDKPVAGVEVEALVNHGTGFHWTGRPSGETGPDGTFSMRVPQDAVVHAQPLVRGWDTRVMFAAGPEEDELVVRLPAVEPNVVIEVEREGAGEVTLVAARKRDGAATKAWIDHRGVVAWRLSPGAYSLGAKAGEVEISGTLDVPENGVLRKRIRVAR